MRGFDADGKQALTLINLNSFFYFLQIADFGLSNLYHRDEYLQTFCGSPLYASPEIVNGRPYRGPEVDTWSLGVLLYTLVHGAMPFDGNNHKTLVQQISTGNYRKPNHPSGESLNLEDWMVHFVLQNVFYGDVFAYSD